LQGPGTDRAAVAGLRAAIAEGRECTVRLLNYKKDRTPFWNLLTVAPIRDGGGALRFMVGIQVCPVGGAAAGERGCFPVVFVEAGLSFVGERHPHAGGPCLPSEG
jgi:hypothetical protein